MKYLSPGKPEPEINLKIASAYIIYLAIIILLQYALVTDFIYRGLADPALLKVSFEDELFQIYVSILLYLIPLNVIIIALFSWMYFERNLSMIRARNVLPAKAEKVASKIASLKITNLSQSIYVRSLSIALLFALSLLIAFTLVNPSVPYEFAVSFYWNNAFFRSLILWSRQINSLLANVLGLFAASFRTSLSGLIKPFIEVFSSLNIVWKYLICQNITAWAFSVLITIYVKYGRRRKSI